MNLALFDLDNTLIAGDSDFEWAQFLISKGVVDREIQEAKNIGFYEQYKAGTLDIYEFLAFQLAPLTRHPRAELDAWHREYMDRHIRPIIGDKARQLVNQHLAAGDLCAVVTATNSFVTGADRPRIRHPAPDRHGSCGRRRQTGHFPAADAARPPSATARSSASKLAGIARPVVGQLHRKLVLQRLAQRPAADGQGPDAGGRRPGRQTARGTAGEMGWKIITLR
jgi:hypothetical protein